MDIMKKVWIYKRTGIKGLKKVTEKVKSAAGTIINHPETQVAIKKTKQFYDEKGITEKVIKVGDKASSNIYEELKSQGVEAEYGIQLHEVPMTAEEAGNIIRDEINEAAWEGFFSNQSNVNVGALMLRKRRT